MLSLQFDVKWSQAPGRNTDGMHLLDVFEFPRRNCTFVSSEKIPSTGAIILAILKSERSLLLRSFVISEGDAVNLFDDTVLEVGNATHCSCNEAGCFTVISKLDVYFVGHHSETMKSQHKTVLGIHSSSKHLTRLNYLPRQFPSHSPYPVYSLESSL
jgi:hypothetical protein